MIQKFKEKYNIEYEDELLLSVILDMNRSLDTYITKILNEYKIKENVQIGSVERERLREEIYYNFIHQKNINHSLYKYFSENLDQEEIKKAIADSVDYLDSRMGNSKTDTINILGSIKARMNNDEYLSVHKKYLEYIEEIEREYYQLAILNVNSDWNLNKISEQVRAIYDQLSNYHYLAIIFSDESENVWENISKTAIYAENFYQEMTFPPFKKEKQKEVLLNFLKDNKYYDLSEQEAEELSEAFYSSLSSGYHFTDLFISQDSSSKILMLQKVKYDDTKVPCPDCFDFNPRGNSYTKVLMKSFECSNPNCISRSKSGRGKRYTYLSAKLAHKKQHPSELDILPEEIYKSFRRDVFSGDLDIKEILVRLYTFESERVLIVNLESSKTKEEYQGRVIDTKTLLSPNSSDNQIKYYKDLPIVLLFKKLRSSLRKFDKTEYEPTSSINIQNSDSTLYLARIKNNSFQYAVTSPPYYNAREYSQWSNMLCYFIDMFANSYHVSTSLDNQGVYLYNIGDIVDQDNIFISSLMSKRRQILGLYSVMFMEISGFELKGNIIWDKGEVQSKRNSTSDLLPHYVKTINAYEHIFIFAKKDSNISNLDEVVEFPPVIKIGPKKKNRLGHTAPYPEELVNQLKKVVSLKKEDIILDPFLGSGTTAIWCLKNDVNCLGIELSASYYQICLSRLENEKNLNHNHNDQLTFNLL